MSILTELPIEEWDPNLRSLMEKQSNVSSMEKRSRSITAHEESGALGEFRDGGH
jgi:hypothetical protein